MDEKRLAEADTLAAEAEDRLRAIHGPFSPKTPLDVLRMVAEDCVTDARTLDGLPFDGRTFANRMGEMYAMIKAIADNVVRLEEQRATV